MHPVMVDVAPNWSIGARPCAVIEPPAGAVPAAGPMAHGQGPGGLGEGSITGGPGRAGVEAGDSQRDTGSAQVRFASVHIGVVGVAKYLVLFSLTSESAKRFIAKPSDRSAVVREVAESAGGSLESYYWMFGQYDGAAIFNLPDSHSMAAVSLAITSSGALSRFETHELIESSDLTAIAERAKGITYQPPGT
jgi:uncharacterized protein with GYD domain